MLRICRASTITEEQNFMAAPQSMSNRFGRSRNSVFVFLEEFGFYPQAFADELIDQLDGVFHLITGSVSPVGAVYDRALFVRSRKYTRSIDRAYNSIPI
jgi:hypothetical protein